MFCSDEGACVRWTLFTRETGGLSMWGWGRHFSRVGETVARSTDTRTAAVKSDLRAPSPALLDGCKGLRMRSLRAEFQAIFCRSRHQPRRPPGRREQRTLTAAAGNSLHQRQGIGDTEYLRLERMTIEYPEQSANRRSKWATYPAGM
jgi:hypothetical protein